MIEKTTGPQLGAAFEHHLAATRNHVRRVEQVFEKRDAKRTTVNCPAIDGIIREAKEVIGEVEVEDKAVLGAALVAAAQAVEHYENGSLISWARGLGRDDCASVLQENLDEEKAADETLREIAESEVNIQASVT